MASTSKIMKKRKEKKRCKYFQIEVIVRKMTYSWNGSGNSSNNCCLSSCYYTLYIFIGKENRIRISLYYKIKI